MVKLIEPLRTCFKCMFVRDNNLRTIDNIFVNVRITKDYIAILVIVHSLLYINNIVRLQCLFQPWTQGLKVLIKWFEKCVKSSNLLNWASGVLKIEANTTWIRRWIFENLRWVIKFFFWRSHLKDLARHWESQSYLPYFVVSWILLGGLDRLFVNWTCTRIGSYIMISCEFIE